MSELTKRLAKIEVQEGDQVAKGDVLFVLDDSDIAAELAEIDARLKLAEANKSRTDSLLPQKAISRQAYDLATAEFDIFKAQKDTKQVEQLLQNASVQTHNVASYFKQPDRFEDMRLFRLAFGPVVHDDFIVDRDRAAVGPLFFESPTGAWERGTYTLVVRHGKGNAELPIQLE